MNEVIAHGHRVMKARAGNCMDQCSAALIHIAFQLRDKATPVDIVWLSPPGDHIFIAVGQPRAGRVYPADFADWEADASHLRPLGENRVHGSSVSRSMGDQDAKVAGPRMAVSGANPKTLTKEVVLRDRLAYMA